MMTKDKPIINFHWKFYAIYPIPRRP